MKVFTISNKDPFIKAREITPPFTVAQDGTVDIEGEKAYLDFCQAKEALIVKFLEMRTAVQHSINTVRKITLKKIEEGQDA